MANVEQRLNGCASGTNNTERKSHLFEREPMRRFFVCFSTLLVLGYVSRTFWCWHHSTTVFSNKFCINSKMNTFFGKRGVWLLVVESLAYRSTRSKRRGMRIAPLPHDIIIFRLLRCFIEKVCTINKDINTVAQVAPNGGTASTNANSLVAPTKRWNTSRSINYCAPKTNFGPSARAFQFVRDFLLLLLLPLLCLHNEYIVYPYRTKNILCIDSARSAASPTVYCSRRKL